MNGTNPPLTGGSVRPHRGAMILTFGILGLVLCFPFGVAAWIMGNHDLREMRAGRVDPTGEGITQGGRICGIIASILALLGLVIGLVFLAFGVAISSFSLHH